MKQLYFYIPIQKLQNDDEQLYKLFDTPTIKLPKSLFTIPRFSAEFEIQQTSEQENETDTTENQTDLLQNTDILDKKRMQYQKMLQDALTQMDKLVNGTESQQMEKDQNNNNKTKNNSNTKTSNTQQLTNNNQYNKIMEITQLNEGQKYVTIDMPLYKNKQWFE